MKNRYMLSALICASAAALTGCVEENFETARPAESGDDIIFGARAGFENGNPDTKTVYSGETYTIGGVTFERIDWLDKPTDESAATGLWDMIEIYSPEAANGPTSHYEINHFKDADTQKDYAYLTKLDESSLQWNGDGQHTFYAMYPSSRLFTDNTTLAQGVKMDGTKLTGIVPDSQVPAEIILDDDGNYIAKPDMRYAYMAAKATATREAGSVSLTFVPVVTAVQIELRMPLTASGTGEVIPTSIAEVQVTGAGIAGAFTAELSYDSWTGAYPTCTNEGAGTGSIQIPVWKDSKPLPLTADKTLTFTVFLRPGADVDDLTVNISPNGAGYKGKALKDISIPAMKKIVLNNLYLPADGVKIDASKWMSQLSGEMPLKKLSLPGTGGSFSAGYSGSNADYFKSQTLTFEQQWAAGIRAFEIISDRPSSATTSLGSQNVTCNKTAVGTTVGTVLTDLINKVTEEGSEECAVAILTYQPEDNNPGRNAYYYAQSLGVWYNGLSAAQKAVLKLYTPDMTLAEARNHVMILVRLNQKDEPEYNGNSSSNSSLTYATSNYSSALTTLDGLPFLVINGCGTGKDRWGARGYTLTYEALRRTRNSTLDDWETQSIITETSAALDISNAVVSSITHKLSNTLKQPVDQTVYTGNYVEYYMSSTGIYNININGSYSTTTSNGTTVTLTRPASGLNFGFQTNVSTTTCWYQEWARVIAANVAESDGNGYWFESYNEKLSNVTKTFEMAISGTYPNYVFINSLCGYLGTEKYTQSLQFSTGSTYGGDGGDIKGLADKLNPAFYKYVLNAGLLQTTGPTGIVMMDYVTNSPTDGVEYDGAYLLPGVVIANNFKFGSGNAGSGDGNSGNGEDGDTQTPGGGSSGDGI